MQNSAPFFEAGIWPPVCGRVSVKERPVSGQSGPRQKKLILPDGRDKPGAGPAPVLRHFLFTFRILGVFAFSSGRLFR